MVPAPSSFAVYSTGGPYDVLSASAAAILGEYFEEGSNHGKRVYRRSPGTGSRGLPEVVLFFWDTRDGKDLSGWWFGDKVGGGQVWARHPALSPMPPQRGWKCPVDGPAQPHVVCTPKLQAARAEGGEAEEEMAAAVEAPKPGARPGVRVGLSRKRPMAAQTLVLTASSKEEDEASAEAAAALLGEYVHQGVNHGKKTFRKLAGVGESSGPSDPPVWLYYWDSRDGKEFSGWWFGASIGGEEVYARADQHSAMPPIKGWKIPYDGAKSSSVSLMLKGHEEDSEMPEEERLRKVKELVSGLESKVDKAVETSQKMLSSQGEVFEEGVRAIFQMLEARMGDLEDAKAVALRHGKAAKKQRASSEAEAELGLLEERIDSALGKARKEAMKAKDRLDKCELEGAEERDAQSFETAFHACMEAVGRAESAVDQANTDEAAMKAREQVQDATRQVARGLNAAHGYAPAAQKAALAEFDDLQTRCRAAEKKLSHWDGAGVQVEIEEPADAPVGDDAEMAAADEAVAPSDVAVELDLSLTEDELLKQMTARVATAEGDAKQALETAMVILKGPEKSASVALCLELLQERYDAILAAQGRLSKEAALMRQKRLSPTVAEAIGALAPRLQVVRAHVTQELAVAKRRVAKAKQQARDERDLQAAEVALPLAMDAVAQAEDAVAAVVAEAGDVEWRQKQMETALQFGEEFGEEIQRALEETQQAADDAQDAIASARNRLDGQIRAARLLPPEQQRAALAEMAPVRKRLIDAQKRLNPYKQARADFRTQLAAKSELEGLSARVAAVESDMEAAMSSLNSASEEEVRAAEAALNPVGLEVGRVLKILEHKAKSKSVGEALQSQLAAIRERGLAAKARLEELQGKAKEERSQLVGRSLAQLAAKDVERAEAWLPKLKEAEAVWAGSEVLPKGKAEPALKAAEALAAEALPAVQAAKTLLLERMLEARQLPEGILRLQTAEELQGLQARVDGVSLRLSQLKADVAARRTKMEMPEVVEKVGKAEKEGKAIVAAAAVFAEDNLSSVTDAKLKETSAKVEKSAAQLQKACEEARKAVAGKQEDPRYKTSPSFNTQLTKLSKRLESVETTLAGMRKACAECLQSKEVLRRHKAKLEGLWEEIDAVELAALPVGDEEPTEKAQEGTAQKLVKARATLRAWCATTDELAKHPHGALKLAMARLQDEGRELQKRLDAAMGMVQPVCERAMVRIFVQEAEGRLPVAEKALQKAEEAEGPFLKGIETLTPAQSRQAVAACEAAGAKAKQALEEVQAFISQRHQEALSFKAVANGDARAKSGLAELSALLQRGEALSSKLGQFQRDTQTRKRAAGQPQGGAAAKAARKK